MYGSYLGPRTGLAAVDIAGLQAIYGERSPDQFEGSSGNDTNASATPLTLLSNLDGSLGQTLTADITTLNDTDVYSFSSGLLGGTAFLRLNTGGLSLLTAKLSVQDQYGNTVASVATTDPTNGNLTLAVNGLSPLRTYYVHVQSATNDVRPVCTRALGTSVARPDLGAGGAGSDTWRAASHGSDGLRSSARAVDGPSAVGHRLTSGLTATKIAERTSDFYALEAAYVLFAVMTVTGAAAGRVPTRRRPAAAASAVPGLRRLRGARVLGRLHDAHCAGKSRPVTAHQRADERHVLDAAPRRDARLHHGGDTSSPSAPRSGALVRRAWQFGRRTPHSADARVGPRSSPSGPAGAGHVSLSHPLACPDGVGKFPVASRVSPKHLR